MPENTIKAVITYVRSKLNEYYPTSELNSMLYIMLDKFFDVSKKEVVIGNEKRLSESELLKIIYAVKDLKKHRPLAYILGEWEFFGLPFIVNEHTLIPRPETEELVQLIIEENELPNVSILDIGTGSGCIAISLKASIPNSHVFAYDVSKEALGVAKQNANKNNVEVTFKEVDILNDEEDLTLKLDVIVSNPPYIPVKDKDSMDKNVLEYEPHLALFVENEQPLLFYIAIAEFAKKHLTNRGKLYFEIHEGLGNEVNNMLESKGFYNIELVKDMNGKNRMVKCSFVE
ncbi:MAG: peptide chain release factor N(5)-glutamine methyltransferase [Bacteroidetes bacterium]|nr:peptide chain release factor N(5)-glutamine methyltransferase [Bacteroidota bacterium]